MIEDTIREYMGESHMNLALLNATNGFSITREPLKYTESMVMIQAAIEKLEPDFVEIWNDKSGWNCNLIIGDRTYKSKHGDTACLAIANAIYNYIRRDNGNVDTDFILPDTITTFDSVGGITLLN